MVSAYELFTARFITTFELIELIKYSISFFICQFLNIVIVVKV